MRGIVGPILERFQIGDFKPILTVAVRPIQKRDRLNYIFPKAAQLELQSAQNITEFMTADGLIKWAAPDGIWQIFTFYQGPSGMCPMLDARSSPEKESLVVDLFNEDRVKYFLESHLNPLINSCKEFLGTTLRALFTDSQEIASEWFFTDDFFDEFQRRRGYDVRPFLPVCFVPNRDNQFLEVFFQGAKPCYDFSGEVGEKIRYDWWETLSDLWAERFCNGVRKWANPVGLQHRIQTYGIHTDILKAYGAADIPETEQLFAGGLMDFLKVAGSAGVIYEKPIVSCEAMVWQFRDHITTPLKWKVAADRLFVAGINQLIYHGYPYCPSKEENPNFNFPGYDTWPNHSTNLNRENPFWIHYPDLNLFVARGQYLMRMGPVCVEIGVFYPHYNYDYKYLNHEDLRGGYLPGFDIPPPGGPIMWFMKKERTEIDRITKFYHQVGNQLREYGYYYIHFNEECFLRANIINGSLIMGNAVLKGLIFPDIHKLSLAMVTKLENCGKAGIKIFFLKSIPDGQPGYANFLENDAIIKEKMTQILKQGGKLLPNKIHLGQTLYSNHYLTPYLEFSFPDRDIYYIKRKFGEEGWLFYIRSGRPLFKTDEFSFSIENAEDYIPYSIDLWTGDMQQCGNYLLYPNSIRLRLDFAPYAGFMLLFLNTKSNPTLQRLSYVPNLTQSVKRIQTNLYYSMIQPGSFEIQLNDSTVRQIQRNESIPQPIYLSNWHVSCSIRSNLGDTTLIEKDLVELHDLRTDKDLKYSCGPWKYTSSFQLSNNNLNEEFHWFLNLGEVCDAAEIYINQSKVCSVYCPPYRIEISPFLTTGVNHIEIIVRGCLRNLLVGYGINGNPKYKSHSKKPLMKSGLIAPVNINCERYCLL
jgi:hypothetical protein